MGLRRSIWLHFTVGDAAHSAARLTTPEPEPESFDVPPEVTLLVIVIAFVGFWLIVLRPARASQQRVAALQQELEVGEEVIISAGIFGTIRSVEGDRVTLEIAPGTVITVARQVVVRRAPEESASGPESTPGPAPETKPDADEES